MAEHEERLQQILLEFLASNSRITILGEPSARKELRVPVISFVVQGVGRQQLVDAVERRSAFGFRSGHSTATGCWPRCVGCPMWRMGWCGSACWHYNTGEWPVRYSFGSADRDRGRGAGAGSTATSGSVDRCSVYLMLYANLPCLCVKFFRSVAISIVQPWKYKDNQHQLRTEYTGYF